MILKFSCAALLALGAAITPALAEDTPAPSTRQAEGNARSGDARDPNRVICRREPIIGSRLGANRRCLTAAEWEAERQVNRQALERGQGANPTAGSGN